MRRRVGSTLTAAESGVSARKDEHLWALDMMSLQCRRALFVLDSAGRGGSKLYGMYPMADMFNHEFGNTEFRVVGAGGGDPRFEIVCGENVRAGDQVMISYGAIDNGWLLQSYGFVDVDCPARAFQCACTHSPVHTCTQRIKTHAHTQVRR